MKLTYNPRVFDQADLDAAKRMIVTPSAGRDTETRWARETPYIAGLLAEHLKIGADHLVLDYGCGVGRLAKALIEQTGCRVLGVDISAEMRGHSATYVGSSRFSAVSRSVLEALADGGLKVDVAFTVWVLQHCRNPAEDVSLLARVVPAGAGLAVANSKYRWVPTLEKGWNQDQVDVRREVAMDFAHQRDIPWDAEAVGEAVAAHSYFAVYSRRA